MNKQLSLLDKPTDIEVSKPEDFEEYMEWLSNLEEKSPEKYQREFEDHENPTRKH